MTVVNKGFILIRLSPQQDNDAGIKKQEKSSGQFLQKTVGGAATWGKRVSCRGNFGID